MPDENACDTRDRPLKSEEEQHDYYLWSESIRKAQIYCQKLAKKQAQELAKEKESKEVKES